MHSLYEHCYSLRHEQCCGDCIGTAATRVVLHRQSEAFEGQTSHKSRTSIAPHKHGQLTQRLPKLRALRRHTHGTDPSQQVLISTKVAAAALLQYHTGQPKLGLDDTEHTS
jgi:hypothetical protein